VTRPADVVIVGGGVVGLSVAYALARDGIASTVLDRGEMGRAASWAGAGILPPPSGRSEVSPEAGFRTLSARMHADWAEALLEETGLDNGYRPCGGLDLAFDHLELAELAESAAIWDSEGVAYEWLDLEDLRRLEPAISDRIQASAFLPGRAQIRNPWHLRALAVACERRGVLQKPGCPAIGFRCNGGSISAVETTEGVIACGAVVACAGPWTEGLLVQLAERLPTPPVRGQIALLKLERPGFRRVIERGPRYLVPRDDGRVLVGSTEEDAGFDARTTTEGIHGLLRQDADLDEVLEDAPARRDVREFDRGFFVLGSLGGRLRGEEQAGRQHHGDGGGKEGGQQGSSHWTAPGSYFTSPSVMGHVRAGFQSL